MEVCSATVYIGKGTLYTFLIIINLDVIVFRVRFFNCFKCFELGEESVRSKCFGYQVVSRG